jgi:3-keto-disaccharide hydrolase
MTKLISTLCLLFSAGSIFAQNVKTTQIPLVPDHWDFQAGKVEFLEYKGVQAVRMNENSGAMFYKDLSFTNGVIEFDVEVNQAMPFATLYFRVQNQDAEHVYLRTGTASKKNAFDAVQYASIIGGVNLWDLQHEFQSSADIKIGEWNHVKLVVSGKQLRVYVNNPPEPNLEIPCMEGNTSEGRIGIGTGFPGQAIFANLIVKPNETEGLSPLPGADLTRHDTRYIRHWQVSNPDSLPYGNELNVSMLPKPGMAWEEINAERRGLVNLSRKFGGHAKRNYVWLRAVIKSDMDQVQTLKMGFSDEIWVFVNQKPVYLDKNLYLQGMRKSPNGRISLDNCSFEIPLIKGDNELLIGVANDFYGWGIMARLENLDGISF